ncbi:MAG: AMP phosphotransferase [Alphaproteobacteria bacterium]|nr:AMP phosphotransferase [Alphaproteobacteria bacterium]
MNGRDAYEKELRALQDRLLLMQRAYARHGCKAMLALEGWDAAGKGGLIRRIAWALDPRHLRVWPIGAPSEEERGAHWLRRFWCKVPGAGEIAIFDRSWYGRVLVERVEGYATKEEWTRAYDEIVLWEQTLAFEGYRILKLFIDITPDTQLERFRERLETPEKRWKLTAEDLRNRGKWSAYEEAYREMLKRTSIPEAPWKVIDGNDKKSARLEGLKAILDHLCEGVELEAPPVPPEVAAFLEDAAKGKSGGNPKNRDRG